MFTFSNLLKRGSNYLLLVLFARSISVSEIGVYSAYTNVIALVILITNFGFSEFLLVNSENKKRLKLNTAIFSQLSFYIFVLLLLAALLVPLEDNKLCFLILIKLYLETTIYNIVLSYHQVEKKIKVISIANIVAGISVILTCLLYFLFKKNIYFYLITINAIYLLIFLAVFFTIKIKFIPIKRVFFFLKEQFRVLKFYGYSMVTVPIYMMAPAVIGAFLLESETMALYQSAFSIANILLLISISLLQVDYVNFLEYQNDILKLKKAIKKSGLKIILINILFLLFFFVFGEKILDVVYKKEEYIQAYYPLIFLLIANIIFMFASITAVLMVVLKLQKEKAKYHIEFIIISIVFGFVLTYFFDIYGLVSSYIVLYSYSMFKYVKKYISTY